MKARWAMSLLASLSFSAGCAVLGGAPPLDPAAVAEAKKAGLPAVLVLLPSSASAKATLDGLRSELADEVTLIPRYVDARTEVADVEAAVTLVKPVAVVLMNNPTVRLYRTWQRARPGRAPPAVAVLSSFLRETGRGVEKLTGVIYEVPLITSLINLRTLLTQPVKRVGVLFRPSFRGYVEEQRAFLAAEGFELVPLEVSGEDLRELRDGLERLRLEERVDALWVLNDNVLLAREALISGWLPGLRNNRTPVVVNVGSLLSRSVEFGSFAVLPDHRALGVQAANLVAQLAGGGWPQDGLELEYPISVETVLDVRFARKHLALDEERLATVDRLVE